MRPIPHMIAYSMTKAAQVNVTRGLAELTKGTRVTVNSVLPGPTMTEGVVKYMEGYAKENNIATVDEAIADYFAKNETTSLLQRFAAPEEIAHVTLFLCTQQAVVINGAAQMAEGGVIRHV